MKKLVQFIPNLLTLGNLFLGCLAILVFSQAMVLNEDWFAQSQPGHLSITQSVSVGCWLILTALLLDFFDGFVARLLNVPSAIGKQLDSLADVVSFGVAPGFLMAGLISHSITHYSLADQFPLNSYLAAFLIPVAAAFRLAKFNIDDDQTTYFKGLATPSTALFTIGLFHFITTQTDILPFLSRPVPLMLTTLLLSFLMVSNIPLFSLKMTNYSLTNNWHLYVFLLISVGLLFVFQLAAFVFIIPVYIFFSLLFRKKFI